MHDPDKPPFPAHNFRCGPGGCKVRRGPVRLGRVKSMPDGTDRFVRDSLTTPRPRRGHSRPRPDHHPAAPHEEPAPECRISDAEQDQLDRIPDDQLEARLEDMARNNAEADAFKVRHRRRGDGSWGWEFDGEPWDE